MPVFRVSAAGGGNMSYWRTRDASLRRPTRGTRAPAESGWMDDVRALSLVIPADAVLSHTTAAHLLRLPLPQTEPRPFHVSVPEKSMRGRRKETVWHCTLLDGQRDRVRGLLITSAHKTWLDLGGLLTLPQLVAVTDVLLRRRLVTRQELEVPRGVRAAVVLRRARGLADPNSLSPRESELRVHLLLAGLPTPESNAEILVDGGWIATGDLVWREFKVVVEYDGEDHATLDQRHQDTITRDELRAVGWIVIVVTARHFQRLPGVVDRVADALRQRGWRH